MYKILIYFFLETTSENFLNVIQAFIRLKKR